MSTQMRVERRQEGRSRPFTIGLILVLALAMFGVIEPAPADANGPIVVVVDDDGFGTAADCDAVAPAIPATIQAGIAAAGAGDTVFVCPGVYQQTTTPGITVDKSLTTRRGARRERLSRGPLRMVRWSTGEIFCSR